MDTFLTFPTQLNFSNTKIKAFPLVVTVFSLITCQVIRFNAGTFPFEIPLAVIALIALFCGTRAAITSFAFSIVLLMVIYLTPALSMNAFEKREKMGFIIFLLFAPIGIFILDWFRRSAQAAFAAEQRFHDLVDHLDNAIVWEADQRSLEFLFVSKQCEELLGYSRKDWISQGDEVWKRLVPNDDQRKLQDLIHKARYSNLTEDRCEHRFITKDGRTRWFQTGFHVHNPFGPTARLYGISVEVTSLKETEARLAQGEAEFKAIFDLAATGMAQCVPESGHFLRVNAKLCDFFGYSNDELLKMSIIDLIHPEDRYKDLPQFYSMIRGEKTVFKSEKRYIRKDGTLVWGAITAAVASRTPNGKPLKTIAVVHDLSEVKRSEEELLRARLASEQASQAKTSFLANMSHEIRTPIGVIQGYAELLVEDKTLSHEGHEMVKSISRNTHQLTEIIGEILDVSKIEADKIEVEILRFPTEELIEDVKSVLNFKAQQKNIEFSFEIVGPTPKYLVSDPTRLKQILLNLGGNAIKFTKKGHVHILFECLKRDIDQDTCQAFKIAVEDTGIGISPESQAKLFAPFSQADASTTRKYGGTGLGLFISRSLAEALGGTLTLTRSVQGEGSCFTLNFEPVAKVFKDHPSIARSKLAKPTGRLNHKKILLVEDSIDNQILLKMILGREGAEVEIACNGREGCDRALQETFDIVLMDIQMPELDGWEAVKCLRQAQFKKPVVALTAHAFREERERSLAAGFNDYLTKPIDRDLMLSTIEDLLYK